MLDVMLGRMIDTLVIQIEPWSGSVKQSKIVSGF